MDHASIGLEAFARVAIYFPTIFLMGAVSFTIRYREHTDPKLTRWALAASIVLTFAIALRALAHTHAAFGEHAFSWENLRLVAVESRWGMRWRWQLFSSIAAVASLGVALVAPRLGWLLAGVAGLGLSASLPLTGHAMAFGVPSLVAQSVHVAGAGIWLGTLSVLWLFGRDGTRFRRFGPLAASGAMLLAASGAFTAWHALPSVDSLWESVYGRLFVAKMVLVALIMTCGYLNWRRFRTSSSSESVWVGRELLFAALVLAVTGWLSETGSP